MTTKTLIIDGTEITKGSTITLYNGNKVVRRTLTVVSVEDFDWCHIVTAKTTKGVLFWVNVEDGNKVVAGLASTERSNAGYRSTSRKRRVPATHVTPA